MCTWCASCMCDMNRCGCVCWHIDAFISVLDWSIFEKKKSLCCSPLPPGFRGVICLCLNSYYRSTEITHRCPGFQGFWKFKLRPSCLQEECVNNWVSSPTPCKVFCLFLNQLSSACLTTKNTRVWIPSDSAELTCLDEIDLLMVCNLWGLPGSTCYHYFKNFLQSVYYECYYPGFFVCRRSLLIQWWWYHTLSWKKPSILVFYRDFFF